MSKAIGMQLIGSDEIDVWDLQIQPTRNADGRISGGLQIGATLQQNMATLLAVYPGEIKTHPSLGVGLAAELLNENLLEARHRIRETFPRDGLNVTKLELYDLKNIEIDATYG